MIAHVLSGSVLPVGVEWAAAVLLFGGAFAALATRRRWWRRAAAAAAGAGLVVTVVGFVADAALPGPALYGLRVVAPQSRTPPDAVFTIGGVRGDGSLPVPTDSQHWLAPFVDGAQRPGGVQSRSHGFGAHRGRPISAGRRTTPVLTDTRPPNRHD